MHVNSGKENVNIKGGCIEGLDVKDAIHIWCSRAIVPIPEGAVKWEKEPEG